MHLERHATRARRTASTATVLLLAGLLAACATKSPMTTGSIDRNQKPVTAMNAQELDIASRRVGAAYERDPKDKSVGMSYASILRMNGDNDQALAVMQQVAIHNPSDRDVLAAYGKAQAAAGDLEQALQTIRRAQTPDRPDWALLSAEGAILDQLGKPEEARSLYRKALDVQPDEPSVLSNLGMSYVLEGDLRTAETYMRKAVEQPAADSHVRQNLALVIGLQGRFEEAERMAVSELAPEQAAANVAYLRDMLSQQSAWSQLADEDGAATN